MADTLCAAFQQTAREHADRVALRTPGGGVEITWRAYTERVRAIAARLAVLGVGRGDAVGLMLTNRPEFALCDTAALHLGATPFSIYNTYAPGQIAELFAAAGNRVVICEAQFAPKVQAARGATAVEHVIDVDELANTRDDDFDLDAAWQAVEPGDVATLIFTSGTTGPPKGVELTHANLLAQVHATDAVLPVLPTDRGTSYLPSAHIADRWLSHYQPMVSGHQTTYIDDMRAVAAALPEARPTIWGAVPRVWEKLKAGLEAAGIADPSVLGDEARAAVRTKIGLDEARWLVSGAAPIPVEVLEYFLALGLPICELWACRSCRAVRRSTRPGTSASARSARRSPGCSCAWPTTASCSSAARP